MHMPPMNVPSNTPERDRGRSDDQAEQLEPDDLINQRSATTSDEEQDEHRQNALADRRTGRGGVRREWRAGSGRLCG